MVKSRVMFLGYCMLLLNQTIQEEILSIHLVIPTENTDRQVNLILAKYRYQKKLLVTPWYTTLFFSVLFNPILIIHNPSQNI